MSCWIFCKQGLPSGKSCSCHHASGKIQRGHIAVFCRVHPPCGVTHLGSVTTMAVDIMGSPASVAVHMLNTEDIIVTLTVTFSCWRFPVCAQSSTSDKEPLKGEVMQFKPEGEKNNTSSISR